VTEDRVSAAMPGRAYARLICVSFGFCGILCKMGLRESHEFFTEGFRPADGILAAYTRSHMIRIVLALSLVTSLHAGVGIDIEAFGKSLGGWSAKGKTACEYSLSGSDYRTYKPEITPTPDGGVFASIRIDHQRGWLASDDHAVLEVTVGKDGSIVSAQSNLALQGKTISSDVIRTGGTVASGTPVVGGAVKVGADLTADLSSKLLREKVVEPGRVNFPAAVRHNYNLLFQAIRNDAPQAQTAAVEPQGPPKPGPTASALEVKGVGQAQEIKK
jgi:hypothetical protein